ncbi:MAG: hypothetical protein LBN00_04830 [Oscillospiraceae bacterium]|jgi:hypothetical protein|nr:hypothetical protein [Oscillospiraceae bacterium]
MNKSNSDVNFKENDDVIEPILDGITDICFDTSLNHVLSEKTRAGITETNIIIRKSAGNTERTLPTRVMLNDLRFRSSLISNLIGLGVEELSLMEKDFINQRQTFIPSVRNNKEALANEIENMKKETHDWLSDFFVDVEQQLILVKATATMEELQKFFQFYMMDTTKCAVATCLQIHLQKLQDRIIDLSKSLQSELVIGEIKKIDVSIAERIPDVSWTGVDSAMFLMRFTSGFIFEAGFLLENLLSVPIPIVSIAFAVYNIVFSRLGFAVAGFLRQGIISKKQEEYLTSVLREFSSIKRTILEGTDKIYDKIQSDAFEKIDLFYQSQVEIAIDAVSHTKSLLIRERENSAVFQSRLDNILSKIDEYQDKLGRIGTGDELVELDD